MFLKNPSSFSQAVQARYCCPYG